MHEAGTEEFWRFYDVFIEFLLCRIKRTLPVLLRQQRSRNFPRPVVSEPSPNLDSSCAMAECEIAVKTFKHRQIAPRGSRYLTALMKPPEGSESAVQLTKRAFVSCSPKQEFMIAKLIRERTP